MGNRDNHNLASNAVPPLIYPRNLSYEYPSIPSKDVQLFMFL